MAKKFLTQIDMNGLEIRNFRVHVLATEPTSAAEGTMYYNSGDHKLYYKNNNAWVPLTEGTVVYPATENPVMDGTAAVGTSAKYAREDHVHPTDTSRAPTSHASSATTYGAGTSYNYGHVKLSDSTSSTSSTSGGTAATPKAVNDALDAAETYTDGEIGDLQINGSYVSNALRLFLENSGGSIDSYAVPEATTSANGLMSASDKTKLNGIATGAEVNVQSDWNQTTTTADDYIKNKPTLGGAAAKGVDTSISAGSSSANLPTTAAVASFVSTQIGAADAMRFKGTIGTGGDVTTLPTTGVKVGDTYRVITAGTYASVVCEVGDLIIATATTPTWTVAQTNIDGAITSAGAGLTKDGTALKHTNSVTAQTTQAVYPIKIDAQGHISAYGSAVTSMTPTSHTHGNIQNGGTLQTTDVTIANGDKLVITDSSDSSKVARASVSFDGSTATKALTQKGTWETFNNYVHPSYTSKSSGLYKVTVDGTGHVSAATAVAKSDITALGIPAQDTTYSNATTSAAGLMSAADKTTLNGFNSLTGCLDYNTTLTITAGETTLVATLATAQAQQANAGFILAFEAYMNGEKVEIDCSYTDGGTGHSWSYTWSIASAQTYDVKIFIFTVPGVMITQTSLN